MDLLFIRVTYVLLSVTLHIYFSYPIVRLTYTLTLSLLTYDFPLGP